MLVIRPSRRAHQQAAHSGEKSRVKCGQTPFKEVLFLKKVTECLELWKKHVGYVDTLYANGAETLDGGDPRRNVRLQTLVNTSGRRRCLRASCLDMVQFITVPHSHGAQRCHGQVGRRNAPHLCPRAARGW